MALNSSFFLFERLGMQTRKRMVGKMTLCLLLVGCWRAQVCAQTMDTDSTRTVVVDSAAEAQAESKIKPWDFFVLPAVSYNSDLGVHYGLYGNVFYYGDGSTFPEYRHGLYGEVSQYYPSLQTLFLFQYDSKHLVPRHRLIVSLSYQLDPMYYFYGFNGEASPYDAARDKRGGLAYYNTKRTMLRAVAKMEGTIVPGLNWLAGVNYWRYTFDPIANKDYNSDSTLFNHYVETGLIHGDEARGGNRLELEAGLVADTRDKEAAPTRGYWIELFGDWSPDLFGEGYHYLKLSAHYRHYFQLTRDDRLVLAYHVAYQGTVAGKAPFFMQQNIYTVLLRQTCSEGLGGMTTLRSIPANRMVGDGYVWANLEFRIKLFEFNLLKRHWRVATNPFCDAGMIVSPYRLDEMAAMTGNSVDALRRKATQVQVCAGIGFQIIMNENSVFSVEIAKGIGTSYPIGINAGLNYIF